MLPIAFKCKQYMMLCRIVISNFTNAIKPHCQLRYKGRGVTHTYIHVHTHTHTLSPQYESPLLTLPKGVVYGCRLCVMNRYLQAMLLVWVIKYQQSGDKRNLSQSPPPPPRYILVTCRSLLAFHFEEAGAGTHPAHQLQMKREK